MNRYCFQLQVSPEHLEEYRRRHTSVWPRMQQALREAGWRNYSLFLRADGLLIGYFESELTLDAALALMAATDVNARWQESMAPLFATQENADSALVVLEEVFHLDDEPVPPDAVREQRGR
ncbi:L-rhamnose mutarotase [Microbacterium sp. LRZ72]|uniref:L-rhamnose mutarotase n=1 Tax=Microbacterium sp. LRZ72 TaxID=2942481 RepID=UPI0029AECC9B|nr:L-rhamnose mutarotase [Microbacterium sp. LRZ72]MDX2376473.1 L-rhamnose mutarotase [Microbacterium sp. LRZ72]